MRRTDIYTTFIALLLFLAFAAYAGFSAWRVLRSTTVTAQAVSAEYTLGGVAEGVIVREETVLAAPGRNVAVLAGEGERLASGQAVAVAAAAPEGLASARRLRELEAELGRIAEIRGALDAAGSMAGRDTGAASAARALSSAVARHDISAMDTEAAVLDALLLGDAGEISDGRTAAMERELESLRGSAVAGAETLAAPAAGLFSASVDGWEQFSPASLTELTPSAVDALAAGGEGEKEGAYGKLVTGQRWYFAAVMAEEDAAGLVPGQSAALSFGRRYGGEVEAAVFSVSPPEDGRAAVVFVCDTGLAATLELRVASAQVLSRRYSGIRVPEGAVRTDGDDGESYVWTVTAMQLERRGVEVVHSEGGYALLRRGTGPDALREGDTVVVSGEDLYDGKVIE